MIQFNLSNDSRIDIGYLPDILNGDVDFSVYAIIYVGMTWMMLTEIEIANLFIAIEESQIFSNGGGEIYHQDVNDAFEGSFSLIPCGTREYEVLYLDAEGGCSGLTMAIECLQKLFESNRIINDQFR